MKSTLAVVATLLSFNVLSAVELNVKNLNVRCKISNDKVERTVTLNQGKAGFTTTKQIKSFGVYDLAEKAISLATTRTSPLEILFTATVDGQTAQLNFEDSEEAKVLIHFMSANCK